MTRRNFGIASGRQSPRGQSTPPAASIGRYAPSNLNPPDDLERRALIFGLLVAGPFIVTSIVLFYLAR